MTPKQEKFCLFFAESGNATDAALRAGYSEKTAYSIGAENLKKPEIQNRLKELSAPTEEEQRGAAQAVLDFFTRVMNDPSAAMLARIRAAENLAKRYGLDRPDSSEGDAERGEDAASGLKQALDGRKIAGFDEN